ncbi:hypothetical protein F5Y13DRAFT_93553 [Hypoxylon sp. FL1857]|nr:hypothetical protein F5Y13DRAFT_93553 [Hypoxylon sp. FL1857]
MLSPNSIEATMISSMPRNAYSLWLGPRASMDSLPEELLVNIVEQLDRKYHAKTIFNLRRVNRKWRRIATPYIYIPASGFRDPFIVQPRSQTSAEFLSNLCWKLSHKTNNLGFAKETVSAPWRDTRLGLRFSPEFVRNVCYSLLSSAAYDIRRDWRRNIASEMVSNRSDAQFAFVMIMCREVKTLVIDTLDTGCGPMTREVINLAFQQQSFPFGEEKRYILGSIESLRLGDNVNGLHITDALSLLSLPTLEHLSLGNLGDTCINEQPELARPIGFTHAGNITTLFLDSCRLSGHGLSTLLSICPFLQALNVKMQIHGVGPSRPPCFGEALETHGKTLQFLLLDTTVFSQRREPEQAARFLQALGSLDGNLRWLIISRADFATVEDLSAALPRSVWTLIILGFRGVDGNTSQFQSLLHNPRIPNLRRIVCLPGPLGDLGHDAHCTVQGRRLPTNEDIKEWGGTVFQRPWR